MVFNYTWIGPSAAALHTAALVPAAAVAAAAVAPARPGLVATVSHSPFDEQFPLPLSQ